jgi:predicted nucleic acid-binding protein
MNYTNDRCFVDTNILVYAHDSSSGEKNRKSRDLLNALWKTGNGLLSTQVLQEFFVIVTQKIPKAIPRHTARLIIKSLGQWRLMLIDRETILEAIDLQDLYRLSFWDALIMETAIRGEARFLLSEDLQHGFEVGSITVVNPFNP